MRFSILVLTIIFGSFAASASFSNDFSNLKGWVSNKTTYPYEEIYPRLKQAIKTNKMGHITTASATLGAKGRGLKIPGNRIVGVYNNIWAVRMLKASVTAGIEAPIRFYITEDKDGMGILSYKKPSHVFAPYYDAATPDLKLMAEELDVVFAVIHKATIAP